MMLHRHGAIILGGNAAAIVLYLDEIEALVLETYVCVPEVGSAHDCNDDLIVTSGERATYQRW